MLDTYEYHSLPEGYEADDEYHPEDDAPAWTPTLEHCTACGADVFFAPAAVSGKANIIDYAPDPNGNVAVIDGMAVFARKDAPLPADVPHYLSHWATCKNPDKIRDQLAARTKSYDREARTSAF